MNPAKSQPLCFWSETWLEHLHDNDSGDLPALARSRVTPF